MPTSNIYASADSYVNEAAAAQNYGQRTRLRLRGSGSTAQHRALSHFKTPFPAGATILSAKLHVHAKGAWASTNTITVDRVSQAWGQGKVNWNNQPTIDTLHEATQAFNSAADGAECVIDVTALVADVSIGDAYYGLRLSVNTDASRDLHSADAVDASQRPWLEVNWSRGPYAPTRLAPSDGHATALSKPTLNWKFTDDIGEVDQAFSQVQVSTSSDFTAPYYDSGYVANVRSQWDLNLTAIAAIPNAATRYWRVRVKDGSGIASPWSDTASFVRQTYGTLTLVNPAASPNNYVDELTPPIDWTFTGAVAARTNVHLYRVYADGNQELIWFWNVTAETTVTVPVQGEYSSKGKFPGLRTGKSYNVVVRVWDNQSREATPGDPGYSEVTRVFTYQRSGVPAPVTALTAVANGPSIVLTWTRATQPDWFCLKADGEEVVHVIDPGTVFVSGTSYSYVYWGAKPGKNVTYEVEAVVKSGGNHAQHSTGNATATSQTQAFGMWVLDPDDGLAVLIVGTQQPDMHVGETGTTYDPLGGRRPVRIIDSIRGFEGSVSGSVKTITDRDNLLQLYGRLKELRFIFWDTNIPGRFEDGPSIANTPDAVDKVFPTSFSFFQTDEFARAVGLRG